MAFGTLHFRQKNCFGHSAAGKSSGQRTIRFRTASLYVFIFNSKTPVKRELPLTLLGSRNAINGALQCTPVETVYVISKRLPDDMFTNNMLSDSDPASLAAYLKEHMCCIQSSGDRCVSRSAFLSGEFSSYPFVFIRVSGVDPTKVALVQPSLQTEFVTVTS